MAKKVYKINKNKMNSKSELNSKADSVLLTGFRKIEEDAFLDEVKETQNIKNSKGWLALIIESLSKKFEKFREKSRMVKELKDLEQTFDKIKNERKDLLEHYTRLIKIKELENQELEKKIIEYSSLETNYKLEFDEQDFLTNSLTQNEDCVHLTVESLNTKFEKVKEKDGMIKELEDLEQTFEKIKNEQNDLLERYTKLIKIQEVEKEELKKSSDKYLFLVKGLEEKYDIDSGFNNQPSFIKNSSSQHKNNPYIIAYDCSIESEEDLEVTRL